MRPVLIYIEDAHTDGVFMRAWTTLRSEIVLDHPMLRLRRDVCRLPDGRQIDDYYVLEERDVALVVALTPSREFVLVEQYKHGIDAICLEIPGVFLEADESDPLAAARRELLEETGYAADDMHAAGSLINHPTRATSRTHLFAAVNVEQIAAQSLDENEAITIRLIPVDDAFAMLRDGRINGLNTVAGLFMAWDYLTRAGLV
jgi:8-oxo-dGTP pyrophosphatase MutT (NUDIX family)